MADFDLAVARQGNRLLQPFGVGDKADLDEDAFEFDLVQFVPVAVLVGQTHHLRTVAEHFGRQRRGDDANIRQAGELALRSEEHTSELQSLMRSSYAVFCLTNKK